MYNNIISKIHHNLCGPLKSLALGGGVAGGGTGDLESNVATERSGVVVIGDLHVANTGQASGGIGSSAGGASWDFDGESL